MSDLERHYANRMGLLDALAMRETEWKQEDADNAARRDETRASFTQGLRDIDLVIVAAGGEIPADVPESSAV
jgi:hypothetical protein